MLHLAVFASGRGSNLRSIYKAIEERRLNARIVVVISNRSDAPALEFASEHGMTAVSLEGIPPAGQSDAILHATEAGSADFIALAGYMKLVPPQVVGAFRHRILNIHPALLPSFGGKGMYGRHVHEAVLSSGAKVSGASVHLVDEEYDRGPIVMQRCIPVKDDDTAETLAARVLEVEHAIYPEALQLFAERRIEVRGSRTYIRQ
jgi:phosphoribosylglycinamide formyltransferase 1